MMHLTDGDAAALIVLVAIGISGWLVWALAQVPHSPGACPRCGTALPCVHCFPCPVCGWMP